MKNPLRRLFGKSKSTTVVSTIALEAAEGIITTISNNMTTTATTTSSPPNPAAANHHGFLVSFLLGQSYKSAELQALGMAIQGAMIVRNGVNKNKQLHWFHAFVLSVLYGFAGGLLGFLWLGKPSSLLSSGDVNLGSCIIAFILVNYTPWDIGYTLLNSHPLTMVYTSLAQLFRAVGLMRFVTACFQEFKHAPSPYYPIPVLGPILYGTLLGNMGGFLFKGLEGHVSNGVPWPIQNGIFCGSFYHFVAHDETGVIGTTLRKFLYHNNPFLYGRGWDEKTFAGMVVSIFMQITGLLQLPFLVGPQFTPFYFDAGPWWFFQALAILWPKQQKHNNKEDKDAHDDSVVVGKSQQQQQQPTPFTNGAKKSKSKKKKEH